MTTSIVAHQDLEQARLGGQETVLPAEGAPIECHPAHCAPVRPAGGRSLQATGGGPAAGVRSIPVFLVLETWLPSHVSLGRSEFNGVDLPRRRPTELAVSKSEGEGLMPYLD